MQERNLNELKELILTWASDRNLLVKKNANRQYLKLVEEVGELAAGLARNDSAMTKDALGDVFVVWAILVEQLGYKHEDVINEVYEIINRRKGTTVNGVFVKDEDKES